MYRTFTAAIILVVILVSNVAFAEDMTRFDHGRLKWAATQVETGTSITWQNPANGNFYMATPKSANSNGTSREIVVSKASGHNGEFVQACVVRVFRGTNGKLQVEEL